MAGGLSLTAELNLKIGNFTKGLANASDQMSRFANKLNGTYGDANKELRRHSLGLKDTARIVQGILVSQAFYAGAGAIRDATSALMEFNEKLDYANVTYSTLFGSTDLANNFTKALQEMSVESIFDYDTLADASKKMLAYGIEYENLLYIMEGIMNFGAMSGDAAAMDRMALAIGQIATRGTLKAEEMRQLANAYVPIYDIIQSSFGLSGSEMGNVGNLALPANEVINAIVEYSEEKFGDVADMAMMTITGLKNRIVDTMKVLGSEMMMPLTNAWKSFLKLAADTLQHIRELFNAGGWGNIFEWLVPDPAMQTIIRSFLANVHNGFLALASVIATVIEYAKVFGQTFMVAFNIVAPIVNNVIASFSNLLRSFTQTSIGAAILRAAALGAATAITILAARAVAATIINALTTAVYGLARALLILSAILAKNKLLAGIFLLTVGIAGVAAASTNAGSSLSNLFSTLSGGGGGITQSDVFKNTTNDLNDASDAADAFNNKMGAGATAADELADSMDKAGGAAKKAKAGLLSFDEVFKLNDPSGGGGGGGGAGDFGLGDFEIPDIGGGGLGGIEIPSFEEFGENFAGLLKGTLLAKLGAAGIGAAIANKLAEIIKAGSFLNSSLKPAMIEMLKGMRSTLLGAAVGLTFDALASLITDKLWGALEDAFKLQEGSSVQATIGASIGSTIGGAIGFLTGGLGGSVIGSAIGHFAGGIVGLLWNEISGALSNTFVGAGAGIVSTIAKFFVTSASQLPTLIMSGGFSGIFTTLGSMFKMVGLKAIAKGGVIGAAVGFVTDGLAALLWNALIDKFSLGESAKHTAKVGQTIGSVIGTVIGGLLGGPIGAVIGSAIGTFAGGFVGLFWDKISEFLKPVTDTYASFYGAIADVLRGSVAAIVEWISYTANAFGTWVTDTVQTFVEWHSYTYEVFTGWVNDTFGAFFTWLGDTLALFSDWDNITSDTLGNWWKDTKNGFSTWVTNTVSLIGDWARTTGQRLIEWVTNTALGINEWAYTTASIIVEWGINTISSVGKWANDTAMLIANWVVDTFSRIEVWGVNTTKAIGGFVIASAKAFAQWVSDTDSKIAEWGNTLISKISKWVTDTGNRMGGWLNNNLWSPIANFFSATNMWNKLYGQFESLKNTMKRWWKNAISSIFSGNFSLGLSISGMFSSSKGDGHAVGGVFNREHIARFAEGNKAEAIIPLENEPAMRPFVDAVATGLTETLAPLLANQGGGNADGLPPMYVGTLIADERGIKELYRKFEVIRVQENTRKGLATI